MNCSRATPSGAGGVAFCSGADSYKFNNNWVCGNLSTGDGAGVSQLGFVSGRQHPAQRHPVQPELPTQLRRANGGGLLIMSAPDTDPTCPGEPDADCSHAFGMVGDGIGRNLRDQCQPHHRVTPQKRAPAAAYACRV